MKLKRAITVMPIIGSRKFSKQDLSVVEKTEDILVNLRRVSETLGVKQAKNLYIKKARSLSRWKIVSFLFFGIFIVLSGILTLIFTPLQIFLSIRLEMTPGLPPFDWWFEPPDEVILRVYLFNVTNSQRFLSGIDKKLKVQEVGPIVYKENLVHSNPVFNDNGTLTYTAKRTVTFLPERNTISLNTSIIMPNVALLLIPAYFHDTTMFLKLGINVLMKTYNSKPFIETTIDNYLWNITDRILVPAEKLAPSLVPTKNVGIMQIMYSNYQNNVTVYIGNEHGDSKFFTINTYDGSEFLPYFSNSACQLKFRNASEGVSYPQMITKSSNLTYWRKTICKLADIRYKNDEYRYGINGYNFEFVPWAYNRTEWEGNKDCYVGNPPLPNGLADISACYWGFPMVLSFPHFVYGDDKIRTYVEGMSPNEEKHGSFVVIEPISGIPLEGKARSQINLRMNKLWGFNSDIQKFSDTIIPLAWLEYHQEGLPWYMQFLMYLVAVLVPMCQMPFSIFCIILGTVFTYLAVIGLKTCKKSNRLFDDEVLTFQTESLLRE
ncbi:hypothetical protein GWI33_019380 [Rhynchophorus ferrugineus]|uniref:Scavenger receptor class B member 1-like protein n=1 Tax=Rhynchophorus ferrugineus TaxID=354439 RepID=A0A834M0J0_RHYFE|nr:hypothetical protein GWI33_019380 [Rhynchophorus ferrugineus]